MAGREEKTFRELSIDSMKAIESGNVPEYASIQKRMADILAEEGNRMDEIKSRIIAYYCDISGCGGKVWIDKENTEMLISATKNVNADEKMLHDIFFGAIRKDTTPTHLMTVRGSYKLLLLLIRSRDKKAESIIKNLR